MCKELKQCTNCKYRYEIQELTCPVCDSVKFEILKIDEQPNDCDCD